MGGELPALRARVGEDRRGRGRGHARRRRRAPELRDDDTRARCSPSIVARRPPCYHGLLTYAANWDDVRRHRDLGELDVIGLNAFFPLADNPGADFDTLRQGGVDIADRMRDARRDVAEAGAVHARSATRRARTPRSSRGSGRTSMQGVSIDQRAQAEAYAALARRRSSTSRGSRASSCGGSTPIPTTCRRKRSGDFRRAERRRSSSCATPSPARWASDGAGRAAAAS